MYTRAPAQPSRRFSSCRPPRCRGNEGSGATAGSVGDEGEEKNKQMAARGHPHLGQSRARARQDQIGDDDGSPRPRIREAIM